MQFVFIHSTGGGRRSAGGGQRAAGGGRRPSLPTADAKKPRPVACSDDANCRGRLGERGGPVWCANGLVPFRAARVRSVRGPRSAVRGPIGVVRCIKSRCREAVLALHAASGCIEERPRQIRTGPVLTGPEVRVGPTRADRFVSDLVRPPYTRTRRTHDGRYGGRRHAILGTIHVWKRNGRADGRTPGRTDELMQGGTKGGQDGRTNRRTPVQMIGCREGRKDTGTDRRTDGRRDGRTDTGPDERTQS